MSFYWIKKRGQGCSPVVLASSCKLGGFRLTAQIQFVSLLSWARGPGALVWKVLFVGVLKHLHRGCL